jgi:hypothetical protein
MPRGNFSVITDRDFIHLYRKHGFMEVARKTGLSTNAIAERRTRIEAKYGPLNGPRPQNNQNSKSHITASPEQIYFDCLDGTVIIGSDAHICRDGPFTTAQRAFIKFIKELKPRIVIADGDVLDFGSISRHDPLKWTDIPPVEEELIAAQKFMAAVEDAAPSNCKFGWPAGNHDARFQSRLASVAPEYAGVRGTRLKDHFSPKWQPCYTAFINDDVVIIHNIKGGTGALRNNVLATRKHTITGHLHAQHVWPVTSYPRKRGEMLETLYGVDCGMLADPSADTFSYVLGKPVDWRSGFVVLQFHKGRLLPPDLATVWGRNEITFQGKIIAV